jgi:hypothetical protein
VCAPDEDGAALRKAAATRPRLLVRSGIIMDRCHGKSAQVPCNQVTPTVGAGPPPCPFLAPVAGKTRSALFSCLVGRGLARRLVSLRRGAFRLIAWHAPKPKARSLSLGRPAAWPPLRGA